MPELPFQWEAVFHPSVSVSPIPIADHVSEEVSDIPWSPFTAEGKPSPYLPDQGWYVLGAINDSIEFERDNAVSENYSITMNTAGSAAPSSAFANRSPKQTDKLPATKLTKDNAKTIAAEIVKKIGGMIEGWRTITCSSAPYIAE